MGGQVPRRDGGGALPRRSRGAPAPASAPKACGSAPPEAPTSGAPARLPSPPPRPAPSAPALARRPRARSLSMGWAGPVTDAGMQDQTVQWAWRLGLDLAVDFDLGWIVKEFLAAPLPGTYHGPPSRGACPFLRPLTRSPSPPPHLSSREKAGASR